ncbi:MAG: hypothetical protein Q4G52_02610 [Clostridia bacterium]|nr:hypothetical protein [Clostridia bacterium]
MSMENIPVQDEASSLLIYCCAINEEEEGEHSNALGMGFMASMGLLLCLEKGNHRVIERLRGVYPFLEQVATKHPDRLSAEEQLFEMLEKALERIEPLINEGETDCLNLYASTLVYAKESAERLGDQAHARSYEKEAYRTMSSLRRRGRLACWLEYSKLLLAKGRRAFDEGDAEKAEKYTERAYRAAQNEQRRRKEDMALYCIWQKRKCCRFLVRIQRIKGNRIQWLKWKGIGWKVWMERKIWNARCVIGLNGENARRRVKAFIDRHRTLLFWIEGILWVCIGIEFIRRYVLR